MLLSPDQYAQASAAELLREAARGTIGLDKRWLRAILERGEACAPDLLAFLREPDDRHAFDLREDVLHIARHFASAAMLPVLVELARGYAAEEWPEELSEAFRAIGPPALEPLFELRRELEDPFEVDNVLATLGVHDPRILQILVEELENDPVMGALALSVYGDPAAIPHLEKALEYAQSDEDRQQIREVIEELGRPLQPEPAEPFDIWSCYPEEAAPEFDRLGLDELGALLESPVATWRAEAAREIGHRGPPLPEHEKRLYELASNDPEAQVRGACWEALIVTGRYAPHRDLMYERLADASSLLAERRSILLALAGREEDPLLRRRILDFYDDPATRALAMEAMRLSGDPGFARFIGERLDDPDPEVRRQAVLGVGTFGLRAELHRLPRLFSSDLRLEALASYAALMPMETSRAAARRALRKIERVAGGLSPREAEVVMQVLDDRLLRAGRFPAFMNWDEQDEETTEPEEPYVAPPEVGRNDPCPCGSGKKYKKCCGA